jgi:hypothetical protein
MVSVFLASSCSDMCHRQPIYARSGLQVLERRIHELPSFQDLRFSTNLKNYAGL